MPFTVDLSYPVEKLTYVVSRLAAGADRRRLFEEAWVHLGELQSFPLTEDTVDSVLTLLQALGMEHEEHPVPVDLPVRPDELPDTRLEQIAEFAVSALVDVSTALGEARTGRRHAAVAPQRVRHLRYRHLAWDAHQDSAEYLEVLQRAFPAYPQDVLQQWFQRHGTSGMEHHAEYVDLERLTFRQEAWTAATLGTLTSRKLDWLDVGPGSTGAGWLANAAARPGRNWLVDDMARAGTWPVSPIVLEDGAMAAGAPNAVSGRPYLLEGHRRTAVLLNLAAQGKAAEVHPVWVASC
jgi:hypothetical protein